MASENSETGEIPRFHQLTFVVKANGEGVTSPQLPRFRTRPLIRRVVRQGGPEIALDVWVAEQQEDKQDQLIPAIPLVPASPRRSKQRLGHPATPRDEHLFPPLANISRCTVHYGHKFKSSHSPSNRQFSLFSVTGRIAPVFNALIYSHSYATEEKLLWDWMIIEWFRDSLP